jgi:hypothetical protein
MSLSQIEVPDGCWRLISGGLPRYRTHCRTQVEGLQPLKFFDCNSHNDVTTMPHKGELLGMGEGNQPAEPVPCILRRQSFIRHSSQIPGGFEARIAFLTGLSNSDSVSPRA